MAKIIFPRAVTGYRVRVINIMKMLDNRWV